MKPTNEEAILLMVEQAKKLSLSKEYIIVLKSEIYQKIDLSLFNGLIVTTFEAFEIDYNFDVSKIKDDVLIYPI
jgi:hypothetical protein